MDLGLDGAESSWPAGASGLAPAAERTPPPPWPGEARRFSWLSRCPPEDEEAPPRPSYGGGGGFVASAAGLPKRPGEGGADGAAAAPVASAAADPRGGSELPGGGDAPKPAAPLLAGVVRWISPPPVGPDTARLCCFCFQVLRAHLSKQPSPPFPATADPAFRAPLFITWLKQRQDENGLAGARDFELRGCIGCLEPVVLQPGLSEYVVRSSQQDRRFAPVRLDEVPALTCKLSILHSFELCAHVHDWQVGVHGVLINFADPRGNRYSATYLPEVARDQRMTQEVAIRELVSKSGYAGPFDQDLIRCIEAKRYQTRVDSVAYWDYLRASSASNFC